MKLRFYRFVAVFLFLVLAFSARVFAWPFGNKKKTETASSSAVSTQSKSQPAASSQVTSKAASQDENFFEEGEEEEANEIPSLPQLPQIPKVNTGIPQLPQVKYTGAAPQTTTPIQTTAAGLDPDIVRIQKQIQDIMKINESLKSNFSGQAAEIQKISDQAKIHGEILKDLDSSKQIAEEVGADKYLNKEKLRLIKEETEKNQKYLQDLNNQKETAVSGNTKSTPLIPVDSNKKV